MIFVPLVHNIALLLSLSILQSFLTRRFPRASRFYRVLLGAVFGCVAVVGMMTPLRVSPGVMFDGRSIVLSIAGFVGGPLTGVTAALITGAYRLWIGGAGAWVGIGVIVESTGFGVWFYYLRRKHSRAAQPVGLLGMGILVHLGMLACMFLLPGGKALEVLRQVAVPVLGIYPLATLLTCLVFLEREALRQSEAHYRLLAENTLDVIWIFDIETMRFRYVSPSVIRLRGYTPEEVMAEDAAKVLMPHSWRQLQEALPARLEEAKAGVTKGYTNEIEQPRRDGTSVWTEVTTHFIANPANGHWEVYGVTRDITQRRQVEERLRASQERFRRVVVDSPFPIMLHAEDGVVIQVSNSWCEITGYTHEELASVEEWTRRAYGEGNAREKARIDSLYDLAHRKYEGDFHIRTKAGATRIWEFSAAPLGRLPDGRRLVMSMAQDVTERRQAEEAIQAREQEFRTLAEAMPQIVWATRPDGWNNYFNQRWVDYTGLTLEQSYGHGWTTPFHPEDRQRAWNAWQRAMLEEATYSLECRLRRADGAYRWWLIRGVPLRNSNGQILKWLGTCTDIEDLKEAEEALRNSEAFRKRVFDASPVPIVVMDTATLHYVDCNPAAVQVYHFGSRDEVVGKTPMDFSSTVQYDGTPSPDKVRFYVERAIAEGMVVFEWRHQHPDGELWDGEVHLMSFQSGQRQFLQFTLWDITQRKRAEEALKESEARLRTFSEAAFEGIAITENGIYVDANPRLAQLLGYEISELIGRPVVDFIAPEDRALVQSNLTAGVELPYEIRMVRKDGAILCVEIQARQCYYSGRRMRLTAVHDITHRNQLQAQLLQAQKMESVGQLAGGVAHDFNNILAAMMLQLGSLRGDPSLNQETQDSLRELMTDAQRAANLTRQLLLFSRRSVVELKVLDLNELMANLLKMVGRLIGEHITLQFDPHDSLPPVEADPGMVEQVLMNLVINARDAMPKGGRLTLGIEPIHIDAKGTGGGVESRPGQFVCLSVTDTGFGMDEAALQHIFEPFFTTKELGKGTGLGLATVYGIAAQHKGWVEVESSIGKGTTFKVYFPATAEAMPPSTQGARTAAIQGRETILVVEDEASVRRAVRQVLKRLGYTVLEASDGKAAMELWSEHAGHVDLLFSDMVMPGGLTGLDLAEKFRQDQPDLKVIITSGYNPEMAGQITPTTGEIVYLQKPYQIAAMSSVLRECLDKK